MQLRIGHGYDVHKLVADRKLILGGVDIPHNLGLLGHSDADVLLHAIMDAIFGAMAKGDIGKHFPDNDNNYLGISSMHLMTKVYAMMKELNASIVNLDATLVLQKPKVASYIDKMRENIAFCLGCDKSVINVKATTEEHLGFTGREEGISAHAVVLISLE